MQRKGLTAGRDSKVDAGVTRPADRTGMGCPGERRGAVRRTAFRLRLGGCVARHEALAEGSGQRSSPGGSSVGPAGRADGWGRGRPRGGGGLGGGPGASGGGRPGRRWAVGHGGRVPTRSRMNFRGDGSRPLLALRWSRVRRRQRCGCRGLPPTLAAGAPPAPSGAVWSRAGCGPVPPASGSAGRITAAVGGMGSGPDPVARSPSAASPSVIAVALHLQAHPLAVPGGAAKGPAFPSVGPLPPR